MSRRSGVRPRMHHYVPVSFLQRFSDEKGFLHVLDMLEWRSFSSKPQNVARERDYYTAVTIDGPEDDSIEKLLGETEARTSPVIASIIENEVIPAADSQEWADMCFFIALLDRRTPVARQTQRELNQMFQRFVAQQVLGSPTAFERSQQAYRKATGDTQEFTFEEAQEVLRSGSYLREMHPNEHIRQMLKLTIELAKLIGRMGVSLFVASKDEFVTGDNPVPQFDRASPHSFAAGWAKQTVEAAFPIGRNHCLILWWGDQRRVVQVDRGTVASVNCQIAQKSKRFLYASSEQFCWMDPKGAVQTGVDALQRQLGDHKGHFQTVSSWPGNGVGDTGSTGRPSEES